MPEKNYDPFCCYEIFKRYQGDNTFFKVKEYLRDGMKILRFLKVNRVSGKETVMASPVFNLYDTDPRRKSKGEFAAYNEKYMGTLMETLNRTFDNIFKLQDFQGCLDDKEKIKRGYTSYNRDFFKDDDDLPHDLLR